MFCLSKNDYLYKNIAYILVKRVALTYLLALFLLQSCNWRSNKNGSETAWEMKPANGISCDTVSIDKMDVKNPYIIYDYATDRYYMTGDGGCLWVSRNLHDWVGPYDVLRYDTTSWVGRSPVITSPEIHKYNGKYYFLATYDVVKNGKLKRSCTTLVADSIAGPYTTVDAKSHLLDEKEMAAHPTFCKDEYGSAYMIYNRQGVQDEDATLQIVLYNSNLARRLGEAYIMLKASDVPWPCVEKESEKEALPLIESPYLFNCGDESMGMLFVAYYGTEKALGVAYSQTGTLNGPWIAEEKPLIEGVSSAAMFDDYDGTLVILVSKDTLAGGVKKSVPELIIADSQFEKLQIKGNYKF